MSVPGPKAHRQWRSALGFRRNGKRALAGWEGATRTRAQEGAIAAKRTSAIHPLRCTGCGLPSPYRGRRTQRKEPHLEARSWVNRFLCVSNSAKKAQLRAIQRDTFSFFSNDLDWVAERVGFEPTVRLPVRRISSAVLSTTQPPLRGVSYHCRVSAGSGRDAAL